MIFRSKRRGFWDRRGIGSLETGSEYLVIKKRDEEGRPTEAEWLDPARMTQEMLPDGTVVYYYTEQIDVYVKQEPDETAGD